MNGVLTRKPTEFQHLLRHTAHVSKWAVTRLNLNKSFPIIIPLSQEEMEDRPRVSTLISSLANYSNTIPPASTDPDARPTGGGARMGTLIGVYLPCIQNIFGVILFIRLTWVCPGGRSPFVVRACSNALPFLLS